MKKMMMGRRGKKGAAPSMSMKKGGANKKIAGGKGTTLFTSRVMGGSR